MRRPLLYALVGLPGAVMSVHLSGCSLIGYSIGANADSKPAARIVQVPKDSRILLRLRNGGVLRGRLIEVGVQPTERYEARYREWLGAKRRVALAQIGDSVSVGVGGSVVQGVFAGVGVDFLAVQGDSTGLRHVPLDDIRTVAWNGSQAMEGSRLTAWVRQGKVPAMTMLTLSTASGTMTVTTDEIAFIRYSAMGRGVGFLVGLTVDAALVATAAAADPISFSPFESSGGCQSSGSTTFP